uniref:Uncharacterized protein n=1 Tax=Malurus cyaneus samueli TaxID=2593467 RepID=A0A8C5X382_9PASS
NSGMQSARLPLLSDGSSLFPGQKSLILLNLELSWPERGPLCKIQVQELVGEIYDLILTHSLPPLPQPSSFQIMELFGLEKIPEIESSCYPSAAKSSAINHIPKSLPSFVGQAAPSRIP